MSGRIFDENRSAKISTPRLDTSSKRNPRRLAFEDLRVCTQDGHEIEQPQSIAELKVDFDFTNLWINATIDRTEMTTSHRYIINTVASPGSVFASSGNARHRSIRWQFGREPVEFPFSCE